MIVSLEVELYIDPDKLKQSFPAEYEFAKSISKSDEDFVEEVYEELGITGLLEQELAEVDFEGSVSVY